MTPQSTSEPQQSAPPRAARGSAVRVNFTNVGGGKMCWETTLPDLEYRTLLKAVKARRAICSTYPEFAVDDDGTGGIFAGFRCVGTFRWQNEESQKRPAKWAKNKDQAHAGNSAL